jgi:ATP-dependent Clp protease ATP-binding subunit ClpA
MRQKKSPIGEDLQLGAELMRVLEHAAEESERAGQKVITPMHVLTAIFNEKGTSAADIMKSHGITLPKLRARFVWSEHFGYIDPKTT